MARDVLIVQTGTANTASMMAGLVRAGARPVLGASPDEVATAPTPPSRAAMRSCSTATVGFVRRE